MIVIKGPNKGQQVYFVDEFDEETIVVKNQKNQIFRIKKDFLKQEEEIPQRIQQIQEQFQEYKPSFEQEISVKENKNFTAQEKKIFNLLNKLFDVIYEDEINSYFMAKEISSRVDELGISATKQKIFIFLYVFFMIKNHKLPVPQIAIEWNNLNQVKLYLIEIDYIKSTKALDKNIEVYKEYFTFDDKKSKQIMAHIKKIIQQKDYSIKEKEILLNSVDTFEFTCHDKNINKEIRKYYKIYTNLLKR